MTKRKLRYSGLGLAVFTAGAIVACGGDDGGTPGGTAGAGAGGKPGIAGAPATAGAQPTAGAAGSVTAGAGGGGSAGSPGFACGTTMPTAALITDFSNLTPSTTNAGDYTFA